MLIVKNTTGSAIEIKETGDTIPASGQITIDSTKYYFYAKDDTIVEITTAVNSGDLVINDGTRDLNATEALDYLTFREALGIPFRSDPDRINGFVSKNTQSAIEESATKAGQARFSIMFGYNGNSSAGRWLELFQNNASNTTPYINAEPSEIVSLAVSCSNSSTSSTFEIFKNGISVASIDIGDGTSQVNTGYKILSTVIPLSAGDELSAKQTSSPSSKDPLFIANVKVTF